MADTAAEARAFIAVTQEHNMAPATQAPKIVFMSKRSRQVSVSLSWMQSEIRQGIFALGGVDKFKPVSGGGETAHAVDYRAVLGKPSASATAFRLDR